MDWLIFCCHDVDQIEMIGKFSFSAGILKQKFDAVRFGEEDSKCAGIAGNLVQVYYGTKLSNKGHACAVRLIAKAVDRKLGLYPGALITTVVFVFRISQKWLDKF